MKKKILAVLLALVVIAPCIMMISSGPNAAYGIESLGWINLAGLLYTAFLHFGGFRWIMPAWAYAIIKEMSKEKDDE